MQISQQPIQTSAATINSIKSKPHQPIPDEAKLISLIDEEGCPFSWQAVAQGLIDDAEFCQRWNRIWADLPFDFEWKPVPIHPNTAQTQPFFAVVCPATFRASDPSDFQSQLRSLPPHQLTATFRNLSNDAQLLIPANTGDYGHMAAFCRTALPDHQRELWARVGEICIKAIAQQIPTWCNTHGHGVPWLHIRFDSRLKYTSFPPQGRIDANSQAIWYEQIYAQISPIPRCKGR